jgi:signal transduction histidine kinase
MLDDDIQREKMNRDLIEMEMLVRDGVAYARTLHGASEAACRVDLDSLLGSLAGDYLDGGHPVKLDGQAGAPLVTRPRALRRVLGNLIDNALKYAGSADLHVDSAGGLVTIRVRDHGPGIPENELDNVMQPFYRLEASRNRDTGGTGLGLAIARQLAQAVGATLTLRNHPDGGLEASLALPETPA